MSYWEGTAYGEMLNDKRMRNGGMPTKIAKIKKEYQELMSFKSKEDELEHNSIMISFAFLSEVEKICEERGISRTELASKLETSKSYITQLFRGTKIINAKMLAKIQYTLNIKFKIEVIKP